MMAAALVFSITYLADPDPSESLQVHSFKEAVESVSEYRKVTLPAVGSVFSGVLASVSASYVVKFLSATPRRPQDLCAALALMFFSLVAVLSAIAWARSLSVRPAKIAKDARSINLALRDLLREEEVDNDLVMQLRKNLLVWAHHRRERAFGLKVPKRILNKELKDAGVPTRVALSATISANSVRNLLPARVDVEGRWGMLLRSLRLAPWLMRHMLIRVVVYVLAVPGVAVAVSGEFGRAAIVDATPPGGVDVRFVMSALTVLLGVVFGVLYLLARSRSAVVVDRNLEGCRGAIPGALSGFRIADHRMRVRRPRSLGCVGKPRVWTGRC